MGLFRSAAEKVAKQWATPSCDNCGGRGRVQGAGNYMENCNCVFKNREAAVNDRQPNPSPEPRQSAFPTEGDRAAFIQQLTAVPPDELTEEEFLNPPTPEIEVRKFLILVSWKATEEVERAIKAKQVTRCCIAESCVCTLNHWAGDLMPKTPTDENALAWIKWWNGWLDQQPDMSITALPQG